MQTVFTESLILANVFLCRQADPVDGESVQPDEAGPSAVAVEENDQFWGLDDIPGTYFMKLI